MEEIPGEVKNHTPSESTERGRSNLPLPQEHPGIHEQLRDPTVWTKRAPPYSRETACPGTENHKCFRDLSRRRQSQTPITAEDKDPEQLREFLLTGHSSPSLGGLTHLPPGPTDCTL